MKYIKAELKSREFTNRDILNDNVTDKVAFKLIFNVSKKSLIHMRDVTWNKKLIWLIWNNERN